MIGARVMVLASAVCFGTTGTAQALGPDAAPLAVGAVRIAIGGALLVLIARLVCGAWPRPLLLAGAAVAVYQLCFFAAVKDTGVAVGTVVALGSAPALAGALSWRMLGTPLTAQWAACTALATAGVLLLVLSGSSAEVSVPGIALALGAGAGYAGYTVSAKRRLDAGEAPESVMGAAFGTGALLLLPVIALSDLHFLGDGGGIAMVVWLGVIPTAVAYVLFARGLERLSAGETATLTLAEPLTAAALGALVLAERPGALAIAGAALVLGGLAALAFPGRRSARLIAARAST